MMVKTFYDSWYIREDCLDAESAYRQSVVIVNKELTLPEIIYQPLYGRTEAKVISEAPPEILHIKVAVYKLDKEESLNRPFNLYFYCWDEDK